MRDKATVSQQSQNPELVHATFNIGTCMYGRDVPLYGFTYLLPTALWHTAGYVCTRSISAIGNKKHKQNTQWGAGGSSQGYPCGYSGDWILTGMACRQQQEAPQHSQSQLGMKSWSMLTLRQHMLRLHQWCYLSQELVGW